MRPAALRVYTRARVGPGWRHPESASSLAGNGDRGHADRARLEERSGACRERGAGRDDVVDEHDPATRERPFGAAGASGARGFNRNAPATLVARWARSRSNWAVVARVRSRIGARGSPSSRAAASANRSAWS